jgi:signal transduction histidine kinase
MFLRSISLWFWCWFFALSTTFPLLSQTKLVETKLVETKLVDSLKRTLEKAHDDTSRVRLTLRLAWEQRVSEPVEAILAGQKALSLAQLLGNDSLTATAFRFIGVAYRNTGEYAKASELCYKALALDEKRGDSVCIGHSFNTLAGILRLQKNTEQAAFFAGKALGLGERLGDSALTAYALLNVAEVQHDQGHFDMALFSTKRALNIWERLGSKGYIAVVQSVMAKELFALEREAEAEKYLLQALSLFEKRQQFHDLALTLNRLARFKFESGDITAAESYALRAYDVAHRIHAQLHEHEAAELLSKIYRQQGKYQTALEYHILHKALHDSIYAGIELRNAALLSIEYETRQKEQQIRNFRDQERWNFLTRSLLIVALVFIAGLTLFFFIRYRSTSEVARAISSRADSLANINDELRFAQAELAEQHQALEQQNHDMRFAQLEIQDQNLQLSELNQEKNMVLGMVSHDLKNPIVAVQGLSEMMMMEDFTLEQYKEFARVINEASGRMFSLVHTFLDAARMDDGQFRLNFIEFDLNSVVGMMVEEYRRPADAKSIGLHFTPYFEALKVFADETATKQILDNIISNAIKYTPCGKDVAVRILPLQTLPQGLVLMREDIANLEELELQAEVLYIRVEVMDEGPGFTEEDKMRLFSKFARLSAQPTGGEHSIGLGLAIAKKLTELMNGRIWCESEVGEGAIFSIELPSSPKTIAKKVD